MKYIVMECHLSYAVVLDEEGRFLSVANRHYQVGQTVTEVTALPYERRPGSGLNRWIASAVAVAACLLLAVTALLHLRELPHASVYVEINPSVRVDVDRADTVTAVEGINEDGRTLLRGYSCKGKELLLVLDELVDLALGMDYLHEGDLITLTLDTDDVRWLQEKRGTLDTHLREYLEPRVSVAVEISESSATTASAATTPPVTSSHYGDSDYGETSAATVPVPPATDSVYGDSDHGEITTAKPLPPVTAAPPHNGNTDHFDGDTDYGDSNYDDETDDGPSDYDETDDGLSDYDETDDGLSDYDETDDGLSDYDETDDGLSYYDETDDGLSDYDDTDDGLSDYDETDDGLSDYDDDDDDDDDNDYDYDDDDDDDLD